MIKISFQIFGGGDMNFSKNGENESFEKDFRYRSPTTLLNIF